MKFYRVSEENHGYLFSTDTLEKVFQGLVEDGWLNHSMDIYNEKTSNWENISKLYPETVDMNDEAFANFFYAHYLEDRDFLDGFIYISEDTMH